MPTYRLSAEGTSVTVTATSSVHDIVIRWPALSGTLTTSTDEAREGRANCDIALDMREFDAGDRLKNHKLRKDLDVARNHTAQFTITNLANVREEHGTLMATVAGTIHWRDRRVDMSAEASGTLTAETLTASAQFRVDMREFGIKPPRILMLKVDEVVSVDVQLRATSET